MNRKRKIVIAGGSGFLGQRLARWFGNQNWDVVILTRRVRLGGTDVRQKLWDGETLGPWTAELEGADAVANLAGRSVDCRYHARNRREILNSRVRSTCALGEAIGRCDQPPAVWLNASTATIYGHSFEKPMDEAGEIRATLEAKDRFSIDVAKAWEAAFDSAVVPRTRKVTLRMAMVLGLGGNSVFPVMRRLARIGLGGRMSSGRQYVSWIHEEDFCRAIQWLIERREVTGLVNVAAPNPLPNLEMMQIFRDVCGVPVGLPAPLWLLEIGTFVLRTETELIIKSRRVIPGRLQAAGFEFHFEHLAAAVRDLENRIGSEH